MLLMFGYNEKGGILAPCSDAGCADYPEQPENFRKAGS